MFSPQLHIYTDYNPGIEHNNYKQFNRPPSLLHYYESCKIYEGDIDDNFHPNNKFWSRKSKIYKSNEPKQSTKHHIGYYYCDEYHTIDEGEKYFQDIFRKFDHNTSIF